MKRTSSPNGLLWIVAAGLFMQSLDTTIVNTALPAIAASLHEKPIALHPAIVAYSLTLAMLTPASGWIADRLGTRRVFLMAVIVFMLGSVLCAAAGTLTQLVAARAIQGAGGAMLMPVGRLALLRAFSRERYLSALAVVSIAAQAAPLIGPVLGGWIVEAASWPWIFMINVPIGVAGCIAVFRAMPPGLSEHAPPPFDRRGFLFLAIAMASFFLGLEEPLFTVARIYWSAVLVSFSVLMTVLYILHARRHDKALFPLSLLDNKSFRAGLAGNFLSRIGSNAVPFLLPLVFQLPLGFSPLHAGLLLLPVALAGILCKPLVAPLVRRYGYTRFLLLNTMILGLSIVGFAAIGHRWPIMFVVIQLLIFGACNSMQFAAMNGVTLCDLDHRHVSSGNSLFSMVQMLSVSFAVSLSGGLVSIFTSISGDSLSSFRMTFIAVGVVTLCSVTVFNRLQVASPLQTVKGG